jgi:hypothetical protein
MLKNFLCFQAMLLLTAAPAVAQLYIGPTAYMQVKGGTTMTIDSVLLIPSANLSLNNIKFLHSNTPLMGPSISHVYTTGVPFNFQGTLGLYYADAQLNGNTAATLQLAYRDGGSNWITTTGTTVNITTHFLSRTFAAPVLLSGVTAASGGVPLPVTIFDLAAYAEQGRVRLDCEIEATDDGAVCELERSSDGKKFAYLEQVPVTTNNRSYRLYDNEPETGANFYRLRQVGETGNIVYSRVCKVIFDNDTRDQLTLYPIPANDILYLNLGASPAKGSYISLTSMDGKALLHKNLSGEQVMSIDLQAYPSGSYVLTYYNGTNVRHYKIKKTK